MTDTTRWGILATGRIAHSFADNLREVPGAEIAAVGSRSQESADAFAQEYGDGSSVRAHASYEALLADPEVDVIYIATPHAFHLENARAAFDAGKHVLCEKPLTLNLAEAEAMVEAATRAGRFLMEAMWMACHPVIRAVRDGIQDGRFGAPKQVHADLGFVVEAAADEPDVQPRARRWRAPRHGHLPADLRPPDARAGRHPRRLGDPQRPGRRPRRGPRRTARRRGLGTDGLDDLDLSADGDHRDLRGPHRRAARLPRPAVRDLEPGGRRARADRRPRAA